MNRLKLNINSFFTIGLALILLFVGNQSYAQQKTSIGVIRNTVLSFLKWHKSGAEEKPGESYFVPRYDGKDSVKTYFDTDSLEMYYNNFRKSGFVSEHYINELKDYFNFYGKFIGPKREPGEIIKIDGLDQDIILNTFEPEAVLDHLDKATITKSLVIYNKALVGVNFSKGVNMIFTLTKSDKKWLIDYIGADNTSQKSFFRQ
ncbi:hypothetical protein [Pedobacter sp. FW305-3-2-15-E-R2A2]|uniref:hypothetical protein n=1 Tax=Pedobacter sp. FW305-3-2-15-E-R2A2 TaxID=3140251 RepID=UPI0031401201